MTKSERIEQVVDGKGRVLSFPMSHKDRKKWTYYNLGKLEYLKYYFILINGQKNPIKVPLEKYRKRYEEEFGTKF